MQMVDNKEINPYSILTNAKDASLREIKNAYKKVLDDFYLDFNFKVNNIARHKIAIQIINREYIKLRSETYRNMLCEYFSMDDLENDYNDEEQFEYIVWLSKFAKDYFLSFQGKTFEELEYVEELYQQFLSIIDSEKEQNNKLIREIII